MSCEFPMTYLDRSLPPCSHSGMEFNLNRLPYNGIHVKNISVLCNELGDSSGPPRPNCPDVLDGCVGGAPSSSCPSIQCTPIRYTDVQYYSREMC